MDGPTKEQIVNQALSRVAAAGGLFGQAHGLEALKGLGGLSGINNQLSAEPQYQKMVEEARQQVRPSGLFASVYGGLTRFDPSTNTRVPVTQEWVNEAVAEIVRLNVELSGDGGTLLGKISAKTDPGRIDRIWEAVRAASAV